MTTIPNDVDVESDVPAIALRNRLIFPGTLLPFDVGREKSVAAVDALLERGGDVLAVFGQREPSTEDPSIGDLHEVGCAAFVRKRIKQSSGSSMLVLEGAARIRLKRLVSTEPYLRACSERLVETTSGEAELLAARLKEAARRSTRLVEFLAEYPAALDRPRTLCALADLLSGHADLPLEEQARLLGTLETKDRILRLLDLL